MDHVILAQCNSDLLQWLCTGAHSSTHAGWELALHPETLGSEPAELKQEGRALCLAQLLT